MVRAANRPPNQESVGTESRLPGGFLLSGGVHGIDLHKTGHEFNGCEPISHASGP